MFLNVFCGLWKCERCWIFELCFFAQAVWMNYRLRMWCYFEFGDDLIWLIDGGGMEMKDWLRWRNGVIDVLVLFGCFVCFWKNTKKKISKMWFNNSNWTIGKSCIPTVTTSSFQINVSFSYWFELSHQFWLPNFNFTIQHRCFCGKKGGNQNQIQNNVHLEMLYFPELWWTHYS